MRPAIINYLQNTLQACFDFRSIQKVKMPFEYPLRRIIHEAKVWYDMLSIDVPRFLFLVFNWHVEKGGGYLVNPKKDHQPGPANRLINFFLSVHHGKFRFPKPNLFTLLFRSLHFTIASASFLWVSSSNPLSNKACQTNSSVRYHVCMWLSFHCRAWKLCILLFYIVHDTYQFIRHWNRSW